MTPGHAGSGVKIALRAGEKDCTLGSSELRRGPILTVRGMSRFCLYFKPKWKLSEEEKSDLKESWTILRVNLESVGVVTFLKLFETHPETMKPFIPDCISMPERELNEW